MLKIVIPIEKEYFVPLECLDIKPDKYEISNYGTVRIKKTGRILRQSPNNSGYLRVELSTNKKGRRKKYLVQRLVAILFIPNPENKPQVNHKMEKRKFFNYYENLEWATASENQKYHQLYGDTSNAKGNTTNHYRGEDRYNANVTDELVRRICEMLEKGKDISYIKSKLLNETDLNNLQLYGLIFHIQRRDSWKHISKDYDF